MYHVFIRPQAAAALALLFCAAGARADLMGLSYMWNRSQFGVSANGGTRDGAVYFVLPGPQASDSSLGSVSVGAFTALANGADRYEQVPYSLTFILTDSGTGASHALTVSGALDGTVTSDGVNLTNTFTGGSDSQSFDFLGHNLTVAFGFTSTGGSPQDWAGAVTASVSEMGVTPAGEAGSPVGGPPVAAAPEPTGLVLAALATPVLGLAAGRMRRRRAGGAASQLQLTPLQNGASV